MENHDNHIEMQAMQPSLDSSTNERCAMSEVQERPMEYAAKEVNHAPAALPDRWLWIYGIAIGLEL